MLVLLKEGLLPVSFTSQIYTAYSNAYYVGGYHSGSTSHRLFKSTDGVNWTEITLPANVSSSSSTWYGMAGSSAATQPDKVVIVIAPPGAPSTREIWSMDTNGTWILRSDPPLDGLVESSITGPLFYVDGAGFYLFAASGGSSYVWIATATDSWNGPYSIALPVTFITPNQTKDGPSTGSSKPGHRSGVPGQTMFRSTSPFDIWFNPLGTSTFQQRTNPSNLGPVDMTYDSALLSWLAIRAFSTLDKFEIWQGDFYADNWVKKVDVNTLIGSSIAALIHHMASSSIVAIVFDDSLNTKIFTSDANDGSLWFEKYTIGRSLASTDFWTSVFSGIIFAHDYEEYIALIDSSGYNPNVFGGNTPPTAPTDLTAIGPDINGDVTLQWTDNSTAPEEDRFFVERVSGSSFPPDPPPQGTVKLVGSVPPGAGTGTRSFVDNLQGEPNGSYTYRVRAVDFDTNSLSNPTNEVTVVWSGGSDPDIILTGGDGGGNAGDNISERSGYNVDITGFAFMLAVNPDVFVQGGDGGGNPGDNGGPNPGFSVDINGFATLKLLVEPSGIYTLVPGKNYDTLYDRGPQDSVDMPIPTPFFRTGFMGD